MKKQKLVFVDIETTGLDPDQHEIIELAGVVVDQDWTGEKPKFDILEEFELKIKPQRIETAEKTALRINGYNEADWALGYTLKEAMQIFSKKTADMIMVAHNVAFDYLFLDRAFRFTGVINKLHYHKLDTISIAFAKLHLAGDVGRFSLQYLCEYFKIENKRAHTALPDARAAYELYKKLMSL